MGSLLLFNSLFAHKTLLMFTNKDNVQSVFTAGNCDWMISFRLQKSCNLQLPYFTLISNFCTELASYYLNTAPVPAKLSRVFTFWLEKWLTFNSADLFFPEVLYRACRLKSYRRTFDASKITTYSIRRDSSWIVCTRAKNEICPPVRKVAVQSTIKNVGSLRQLITLCQCIMKS